MKTSLMCRAFVFSFLVFQLLSAQPFPLLDPAFAPVITRDGGFVSSMALQSDGKLVIAGGFNAINGVARQGLARLNADGSLDGTFDADIAACCGAAGSVRGEFNAPVSAVAIQPDGRILIAGGFTTVRGVTRNGVARLLADGSLDTSFDSGAGLELSEFRSAPPVSFLLPQADGRVVIGGRFVSAGGVPRNGIARLNGNGTVDTSFDPGTGFAVTTGEMASTAAMLPTGKILIGGAFATYNEIVRNGLARLNADGSLDQTFDPQVFQVDRDRGSQSISGFAVQPGGKIVISGVFDLIEFSVFWEIGRLNPDGTLDNSFAGVLDVAGGESFKVLASSGDGKLLGLRTYSDATGNHRAISRLNSDGTKDSSYSPLLLGTGEGGRLNVSAFALQSDGRLLIGGALSPSGVPSRQGVVRIQPSGGLDASFAPGLETSEGGVTLVQSLGVQADGKVVAGGGFTRINGVRRELLARFNRDGSLDSSFAPVVGVDDQAGSVSAIKIQEDGRILIGGNFRSINGLARNGLARLEKDGSVDGSFQVGTGTNEKDLTGQDSVGRVTLIQDDASGMIWIGGDFLVYGGIRIPYVARLTATGALDGSFNMGFRLCDICEVPTIRAIVPLADGTVMIGGRIDRIGVGLSPSLVRLQRDGIQVPVFDSQLSVGEEILAMVQADDGTLTALTALALEEGGYKGRLIRFTAEGQPDSTFKAEPLKAFSSGAFPASVLTVDSTGRLIIGGGLQAVGETVRKGMARFLTNGTLDGSFQTQQGISGGIFAQTGGAVVSLTDLSLDDAGGVLIAGNFSNVEGKVRFGLARLQVEEGGTSVGGRPMLTRPTRLADGVFEFEISGEGGRSYRVEASADLTSWRTVGNLTLSTESASFRDPESPGATVRFYRVVLNP